MPLTAILSHFRQNPLLVVKVYVVLVSRVTAYCFVLILRKLESRNYTRSDRFAPMAPLWLKEGFLWRIQPQASHWETGPKR